LQAELSAKTAELPALKDAVTEIELVQIAKHLTQYIQQNRLNLNKYQANQHEQAHLSQDVEIVHDIRVDLDGRIDQRVQGPMTSRFKTGLLADNLDAHNIGAEKMNQNLAPLVAQAKQLLVDSPDLLILLEQPELLDWLQQRYKDLSAVITKQRQLTTALDKLNDRELMLDRQIKKLQDQMLKDFDVETETKRIKDLVAQRDALDWIDKLDAN